MLLRKTFHFNLLYESLDDILAKLVDSCHNYFVILRSRLRPFGYRYRILVSVAVTVSGTVKVLNGTRYRHPLTANVGCRYRISILQPIPIPIPASSLTSHFCVIAFNPKFFNPKFSILICLILLTLDEDDDDESLENFSTMRSFSSPSSLSLYIFSHSHFWRSSAVLHFRWPAHWKFRCTSTSGVLPLFRSPHFRRSSERIRY